MIAKNWFNKVEKEPFSHIFTKSVEPIYPKRLVNFVIYGLTPCHASKRVTGSVFKRHKIKFSQKIDKMSTFQEYILNSPFLVLTSVIFNLN